VFLQNKALYLHQTINNNEMKNKLIFSLRNRFLEIIIFRHLPVEFRFFGYGFFIVNIINPYCKITKTKRSFIFKNYQIDFMKPLK